MRRFLGLMAMMVTIGVAAGAQQQGFTLRQVLSAPYALGLTAAPIGAQFAWIENAEGVRNIWVGGPRETARAITHYSADDGQDINGLAWAPDAGAVAYAYGAENGANGRPANPAELQRATPVKVWVQPVAEGKAVDLGEGRAPLWMRDGKSVLFVRGGQIWIAELGSKEPKERELVFDRGRAGGLTLSPDGTMLAFVSGRGGHSFIGVFDLKAQTLRFLAPATGRDFAPSWSPDGREIAWLRAPFTEAAEFAADRVSSDPWSVMLADVATGKARAVFTPEAEKPGSVLPHLATGSPRVFWVADGRVVFFSEADGWVHLYSVDPRVKGAKAVLLTPGKGEVEDVTMNPDGTTMDYASNYSDSAATRVMSEDQRQIWSIHFDGGSAGPVALTHVSIETHPQTSGDGSFAALVSSDRYPMQPATLIAGEWKSLCPNIFPSTYPASSLVTPQQVFIPTVVGEGSKSLAKDDVRVSLHGQLFLPKGGAGEAHAALIFFHGGPRREMLLGYPAMGYYSNAYAMNQYLASRGFVVLSVNYHCGIGYGMEFRQCLHAGADGASEYADVLAAVKWLRARKDVDASRIGIWGGSYGGYLTAMALARNSDLFAAGVDFHGVHDWNLEDNAGDWLIGNNVQKDAIAAKARASSPIGDVAKWRSPVLLIHGDNDPEVAFNQTPMLADALRARHVPVEELIFPDEVHEFLLHKDWLAAYEAEAAFFERVLKP